MRVNCPKFCVVIASLFCLLFLGQLSAQECSATPANRELFYAFLRLQCAIADDVDSSGRTDEAGAAALRKEASALFGISPEEFGLIARVSRNMRSALNEVSGAETAYIESEHRKQTEPSLAQMRQFVERRQLIIDSAVQQVKADLSVSSWQAVESYVCTRLRARVRSGLSPLRKKEK